MSRPGYRTSTQTSLVKDSQPLKRSASNTAIPGLDLVVQRLGDKVLPKQPYLLSVQSDKTSNDVRGFANSWCVGPLFGYREGQLQYLSFLPRLDEEESLLKAEGEWWNEAGDMMAHEPSPGALPHSGRNTPLDQGQRKKISLKDYKIKDKTSTPSTSLHPDSAVRSMKSTSPQESLESKSISVKGTLHLPPNAKQSDRTTKTQTAQLDGKVSPRRPRSPIRDSFRPEKRQKLSPPENDKRKDSHITTQADITSRGRPMPRLLSPTLPSPERGSKLPELLLPDLPPSLLKVLSACSNTSSVGSITPQKRTDGGLDDDSQPKERPKQGQEASLAKSPAKTLLPGRAADRSPLRPDISSQGSVRASPGPRQRHTIILKYGKRNRKRVEALLKFPSRPKKVLPPVDIQPVSISPTQIPAIREISKREKVDSRENSVGPPAKRFKAGSAISEALKRPATPLSAVAQTPPQPSTAAKAQVRSVFSTPQREKKSAAVRRVESIEEADALTPPATHRNRLSTPEIDRSTGLAKVSPGRTSAPVSKDEDRQQWSNINAKYFALGRKIKHEGTAAESDKELAKSVVLLIEALVCFMINIAAQSQIRSNVDPGWNTIIPYHIYVFRASRKYPHLHGLVIQLGAVCRQFIHKYDMDRLARDPLPDEQCNSAPTPGSDGNTKTNEDGERYKRIYLEFRDGLVNNARELQTAWSDGLRRLPVDALEREYPETWSRRCKDSTTRGTEKITPNNISKNYYLPLDPTTTAFEAARMTLAFLKEWARKEKVDWRTRIDL